LLPNFPHNPPVSIGRRPLLRIGPDYETGMTAYHSQEYQAAKAIRYRCADSDVVIVEGME